VTLKTGKIIKFCWIDEFTGKEVKLTGKILGDYLEVRKQYPIECAKIPEGFFLAKVKDRSGFFVVGVDEILDTIKGVTNDLSK
jgi:hypothetical protein